MTDTTRTPAPVTVLGLGAMGAALARALLAAGHPTTVWNRTPARADALRAAGAAVAADPAAAVRAAPLVVVCLLDTPAVDAVLDAAGPLAGRTVVNLTSSTPEDARAVAGRVVARGARYVDGTVMVPTPLVGTPDGFVLYSGDPAAFAEHRATLAAFGGDAEHLGADPGRAAVLDLGMLDVFFAGMTAFLHAAAVAGTDGVPATAFLPYARRVLGLLDGTFADLARDVDAGEHPGDEDTLEMELTFLDHIVATSRARGVDPSVAGTARAHAATAVAAGYGKDGWSRVVDVLRGTLR
ncbi:MAG: NAD(P)-binding domain-containing protein [Pseudonocardiales bacterium]|nr:NAD(P)-binding domain-containing protein [Pseudonocardiales bacterium]